MRQLVYPVIFTPLDDKLDTVLIEIPDLNKSTEGYGFFEAIEQARDLLGLVLMDLSEGGNELPKPSDYKSIDVTKAKFAEHGDCYVSLVDIDLDKYIQDLYHKVGDKEKVVFS